LILNGARHCCRDIFVPNTQRFHTGVILFLRFICSASVARYYFAACISKLTCCFRINITHTSGYHRVNGTTQRSSTTVNLPHKVGGRFCNFKLELQNSFSVFKVATISLGQVGVLEPCVNLSKLSFRLRLPRSVARLYFRHLAVVLSSYRCTAVFIARAIVFFPH
jgi:hypothetical protein